MNMLNSDDQISPEIRIWFRLNDDDAPVLNVKPFKSRSILELIFFWSIVIFYVKMLTKEVNSITLKASASDFSNLFQKGAYLSLKNSK